MKKGGTMLRKAALVVTAMMTLAFVGCASSTLDENWGRSFETAKANQILNQDAARNLAPIEGLDGPSSQRVLEQNRQGGFRDKKQSGGGLGVLTIQK